MLLGVEFKDNSRVELIPRAMHMCIIGRTKFPSAFFHRLSLRLHPNIPSFSCNSKKRCSEALSSLLVRIIGWTADSASQIEFPDNWEDVLADSDDDEELDTDFCASCTRSCKSDFDRTQVYFWSELPKYFGLPKWDSM